MIVYNLPININEIIECNLSQVEREELIKTIFYDYMNHDARKSFLESTFKDFNETEEEFDNRQDVLKSLDVVIDSIKYL